MIEASLKHHLQKVGEVYAMGHGMSHSATWLAAANDASFMRRIESGGSFSVKTYDRIMGYFSAHWPVDTPWPADIPRPADVAA